MTSLFGLGASMGGIPTRHKHRPCGYPEHKLDQENFQPNTQSVIQRCAMARHGMGSQLRGIKVSAPSEMRRNPIEITFQHSRPHRVLLQCRANNVDDHGDQCHDKRKRSLLPGHEPGGYGGDSFKDFAKIEPIAQKPY